MRTFGGTPAWGQKQGGAGVRQHSGKQLDGECDWIHTGAANPRQETDRQKDNNIK